MSKTPFSSKCAILAELWLYYRDEARDHAEWSQFFSWADVALPLSYMLWQEIAVLPETNDDNYAKNIIEETWTTFCEMISIDPEGLYYDIGDAWTTSPNSPYSDSSIKTLEM